MADQNVDAPAKADSVDGCVASKAEKEEKPETNGHEKCLENGKNVETNGHKAETNGKDPEANDEEEEEEEEEFLPKVNLPLVDSNTLEDNEDVIVQLRSRIYRYDTSEEEPEFKERGTGNVKILLHKETNMYRILMRREITLKVCANHYITSSMQLKKHNNSEKVFVYSTLADLYEEVANPETFAIRFSSPENATIFKNAFDEAVECIKKREKEEKNDKETEDIAANLEKVTLDSGEKAATTAE